MGRFKLGQNKLRMNLLWFNVFLILVLSVAVNGKPKPNPKPKASPKPDPKADPKARMAIVFPGRRDFQYNDWQLADPPPPPPEPDDLGNDRRMFWGGYGGYGGYGGGWGRPYGRYGGGYGMYG